MTSHAELSKQLALALGYPPESVAEHTQSRPDERLGVRYYVGEKCMRVYGQWDHSVVAFWHLFDYRSPDVAMPLLVWLMREHGMECYCELGLFVVRTSDVHHYVTADTLEEAIARAVIAVKGGE